MNIDSIKLMELRKGDILVLSCERSLCVSERVNMREDIQREFPNHKAIVLAGGLKLDAVSKEELQALLSESEVPNV